MIKTINVKEVSEDPTSGRIRWHVKREDARIILDWLDDDFSKIRAHRSHKSGGFGFSTGCGYAIFDADLLGGNGDGTTERRFEQETGYQVVGR